MHALETRTRIDRPSGLKLFSWQIGLSCIRYAR
jgi:hypothetical protein